MDGEDPAAPGDPAGALSELGELGLIQRVRRRLPPPGPAVLVGLGDDTAVVAWPADRLLLLTTDTLVEDVHFRRATATLRDVGAKALAVNLSDIAAMGGEPRFALLALACPPDCAVADLDELYAGLLETAAAHGVDLIGGDTCTAPDRLVVTVTLAGAADGPPLTRGGARPGDAILVTGTLGASAAGLAVLERAPAGVAAAALAELARAHRRPTARVAEGRVIRAAGGATAMIDLSDGLATDLAHIAEESGVGARIRLGALPVSEATRAAARALAESPRAWAVSGGEDYELLFTAAPDRAAALAARVTAETGTPVSRIGEVRPAAEGVVFLDEAGEPVEVRPGFEHFR
jgi:thiamine-monophosphate kinase